MSSVLDAAAADILASGSAAGPATPRGCVLGVAIDHTRTVSVAGFAGLDPTPMTRQTVLDLASVTKVVGTATALHRLASEAVLDLDAPVVSIVPGFGGDAATTVADLLAHRGGLAPWQPLYLVPAVRAVADVRERREAALEVALGLPLEFAPGGRRHYSDLGFIVLGRVIEVVAGMGLEDAVQALVAEPLAAGLRYGPVAAPAVTTSVGDRAEQAMVATGEPYPVAWPDDGFGWREAPVTGEANDGNCFHALAGVAGHAGLFASIDDLLEVGVRLSRADEDPALFHPDVTARMFAAGPDPEQALGWRRAALDVAGERLPLLWHPGFTGTALGFIPGRGIAIAFAANRLLADEPAPTTVSWQRVLEAAASMLNDRAARHPGVTP